MATKLLTESFRQYIKMGEVTFIVDATWAAEEPDVGLGETFDIDGIAVNSDGFVKRIDEFLSPHSIEMIREELKRPEREDD